MGNSASTRKPAYNDKMIFSKKITYNHPDSSIETKNYTITFVTDSSKTFIYEYKNKLSSDSVYTHLTAYGTWTQDKTGRFTLSGQQITNKHPYLNIDEPCKEENKSTTAPFIMVIDDIYEWQQAN
tara:strand:- start:3021 stop:3395 length:375 start_codon:yes stop_codon:yes gene_type:complete